jgi:IS30 family transposase
LADKRKEKAWEAKHPLKNKEVYVYVINKLKDGWSPEAISGRLKEVKLLN